MGTVPAFRKIPAEAPRQAPCAQGLSLVTEDGEAPPESDWRAQ